MCPWRDILKNTWPLLIIVTLLFSCDMKKDEKKSDDRFTPNDPIGDTRELNADEEGMVKTICEGLRDKRNYMSTLLDNTLKLRFGVSEKNCRERSVGFETTIETTVAGNATEDFRIESAYRGNRFSDIVTDSKGMAYPLCSRFFNGQKLETIIAYDGAKYKYRILNQQNESILELAVYLNDNSPSSIEQVYFFKSGSSNGVPLIGMAHQRNKSVNCAEGGQRILKQKLLSASE